MLPNSARSQIETEIDSRLRRRQSASNDRYGERDRKLLGRIGKECATTVAIKKLNPH
jgi:hypothetical protein